MKQRQCQVSVDLDAIRSNYQQLKNFSPNSKAIAVIKADAYGHGSVAVAQALSKGTVIADAFAVATVNEAVHLREHQIQKKIIVLGGFLNQTELDKVVHYQLDPVVHSEHQLVLLQKKQEKSIELWVKVNTGMGRLGFNLEETAGVIQKLSSYKTIRMITHLANADDVNDHKTQQQLDAIKKLSLDQYEWSVANSAGTLGFVETHKQWNRLGIALYGANPFEQTRSPVPLSQAMTFSSKIMAIYQRKKGDTIGYGGAYTCPNDMVIGVIAVGYGDGYPRHISTGAKVLIKNQTADILGRVSMDMLTVDLTDISEVTIEETAILWNQQLTLESVAKNCETIPYELCCNVGSHNPIQYQNK